MFGQVARQGPQRSKAGRPRPGRSGRALPSPPLARIIGDAFARPDARTSALNIRVGRPNTDQDRSPQPSTGGTR
jgi:hypothetical protein